MPSRCKSAGGNLGWGLCLIGALVILLFFAWLARGISLQPSLEQRWLGSSSSHPLGTDELGRDFLSCLVCASGFSLALGLSITTISLLVGLLLGGLAGWYGGAIDGLIQRLSDVILAFPGMLLALALLFFLGPGVGNLLLALMIPGWIPIARVSRAEVLRIREREFIAAARSYNAPPGWILRFHVLPWLWPVALAQAVMEIARVIMAESALNFLGLGVSPRLPTLGQLIDSGRGALYFRPALTLLPGLILFVLLLGFNLLADGFRQKNFGGNQ